MSTTRWLKILSVTVASVALISAIALAFVAPYYLVRIREANELIIQAYRAEAAGNYDFAIAQYTAALRKRLPNQQKALVLGNRGHVYNSKRQFTEAIADETEAIRLNPQLSYPFSARGYSYSKLGELDKAFADLTKSIRLDPNSDYSYYNRGLVLKRIGQLAEALADFDEAVRCSPDRADRLVTRALC